jgi:hypothetical protein
MKSLSLRRLAALLLLPLLGACAGIEPARMALPAALAGLEPVTVSGLGAGRSGTFQIGSDRGRFERGLDRLDLFEVLSFDRAPVRYSFDGADGRSLRAACTARQTTVSVGVLQGQTRPLAFQCVWSGAREARMNVSAPSGVPGTRAERSGRFEAGGVTLELRSVHQVQGSRLALDAPIGYVLSADGRPVGAVEINGTRPRLWRPAEGSPLREPVTLAALALALLWDPASAP